MKDIRRGNSSQQPGDEGVGPESRSCRSEASPDRSTEGPLELILPRALRLFQASSSARGTSALRQRDEIEQAPRPRHEVATGASRSTPRADLPPQLGPLPVDTAGASVEEPSPTVD